MNFKVERVSPLSLYPFPGGGCHEVLRPYQQEAMEAVIRAPERGIKRPMIVLPTGMGKTVVFTSIAKEMNTRTLVIAHREELLTQAQSKFRDIWPGVSVGIVQGQRDVA